MDDSHRCPSCYHVGPQLDQCYHTTREKDSTCVPRSCSSKSSETAVLCDTITHVTDNCPVCLKYNCYFSNKCHDDSDIIQKYVAPKQRPLFDTRENCICLGKPDSTSDTQENTSSCRCTVRSQIRNLQKIRKKLSATEATDK